MNRFRIHRKHIKALFLGLILVCAQTVAHAHEVVHDPAAESGWCTSCTLSGADKTPVTGTTFHVIPTLAGTGPVLTDSCLAIEAWQPTPEARGPPTHS